MPEMKGGFALPILIEILICLLLVNLFVMLFSRRRRQGSEARTQSDPVTGGLNEYAWTKKASFYLTRYRLQYAFVVMEVCNYRQIVQTFGRGKTNQTQKYLYDVLKAYLSSMELLARFSGGMYGFLLKNRQEEEVRTRLTRITHSLSRISQKSSIPFQIEVRFGVYIPENGTQTLEEMREKIAEALDSGDEQIVFYRQKAGKSAAHKWELIQEMDRSLSNGDFQVYMQPKVRLRDNRITGAEALIRWRHPQRGMLTPEMFIPILEEYHQLPKYDLYLFEQVCSHMNQWEKAGRAPCPVSVNLSYETVQRENFLEPYVQLTQKYGISPELIEFELGRKLQRQNIGEIIKVVESIHAGNFRCSLDNFGREEIPLELLRQLNIDTIKLDGSLFSGENNNRRSRFILEAIFKFATQMQIHTVAEGIDNVTQIRYLKESGCDMVQGYYYFQPMPIEKFCNAVYENKDLRYVEEERANPEQTGAVPAKTSSRSFVMFSMLTDKDSMSFSSVFSPVLEGRMTVSNAMAMLRYSDLIHENDRMDFFHLLERCQKERGWVENAIRFYTANGRYEWLEVHMHKEYIPAVGETVISGTMVNMAGWKNEVNRWREKANRDALTGLYNREYFESHVNDLLRKDRTTGSALIFVDIDDFKNVNDTLGHVVGDDVICWMARRVLGAFRHSDIVARYGGDEFVVFAGGIEREELKRRLQQLCEDFRLPYRKDAIEYSLSGSVGAAMFPEDGSSYLNLLENADNALYEAKRRGKNGYVLYHPGMAGEHRE